jgi:hypothetical protein
MTRAEARLLLEKPLVFGDERQIAALRFLEKAEGVGLCESCEGSGECKCERCGAEHDCAECDGDGFVGSET